MTKSEAIHYGQDLVVYQFFVAQSLQQSPNLIQHI